MTIEDILIVGIGGFLGAVLRFLLSEKLKGDTGLPLGTLFVNLTGSFFIGVLFGMQLPKIFTLFLISGFAGAFTTFSTLQKEVIEQWRMDKKKVAVIYVFITYIGGIALAGIGYFICR